MNVIEEKEIEQGIYTVQVQWVYDDDGYALLDYLGEFTSKLEPWVVDRQEGVLYGDWPPEPEEPDLEGLTDDEVDAAWNKYDELRDKWQDVPPEIVARVWTWYGRNEYRYFKPEMHVPHRPEAWADVSDASVTAAYQRQARALRRHTICDTRTTREEQIEALDILYAAQDFERMEHFNRGDWFMMGCIATVFVDDEEMGLASMWGIESDGSQEYKDQIEKEEVAEAFSQVDESVARLKAILEKIEEEVR